MAFHMLQCIFTIYAQLIWCKDVIQWKRIKMNQVSDTFKSANIFHSIILQEAERVAIDHFLKNTSSSIINLYQQCNTLSNKLGVAVYLKYVQYLKDCIKTTTDEARKFFTVTSCLHMTTTDIIVRCKQGIDSCRNISHVTGCLCFTL